MRIKDDAMEKVRAAAHLEVLKRAATLLVDAYARGRGGAEGEVGRLG